MCHTNHCNLPGPKSALRYDGDFVISGFVIPGFHCTNWQENTPVGSVRDREVGSNSGQLGRVVTGIELTWFFFCRQNCQKSPRLQTNRTRNLSEYKQTPRFGILEKMTAVFSQLKSSNPASIKPFYVSLKATKAVVFTSMLLCPLLVWSLGLAVRLTRPHSKLYGTVRPFWSISYCDISHIPLIAKSLFSCLHFAA